jgi:RNA polymerase sigma-70 factor (ECF subfamily)
MCDEPTSREPADPAPQSDAELVRALRRGEADAVRELVERFQGVILALGIRMLGHRHDAEDVAQETIVRALRAIHGFDQERPLRPWLLGIAANRCRTALSRRARRPIPVESVGDQVDTRERPGDPNDLAAELERALERLRPGYRAVFVLFHEQGLPYEEISAAIGRPLGTVKTWLHRARTEIAEDLARRGFHLADRI